MSVALHLSGPTQKSPEFMTLAPHEFPEFHKADLLHLHAGVGFDAPEKIRAAPRGQTMATGGVPQEADLVAHSVIITTKDTKVHEGKSQRLERLGWSTYLLPMLKSRLCLASFPHD